MIVAADKAIFFTDANDSVLKDWEEPKLEILQIVKTETGVNLGLESENALNMFS